MAEIHVKKGNPYIASESGIDFERYKTLCYLVEELNDKSKTYSRPYIMEVWLYVDKLTICTTEKKRTQKYPTNIDFDWILNKVRAAAGLEVKTVRTSAKKENERLRLLVAQHGVKL